MTLEIREVDITCQDAIMLLEELNRALTQITGASGSASFDSDDMNRERSIFVISYCDGVATGCGAIRELSANTAELKRVYARKNQAGIGSYIVKELEEKAKQFKYQTMVLETRKINQNAVAFYQKNGYQICAPYGKYITHQEAICFRKNL